MLRTQVGTVRLSVRPALRSGGILALSLGLLPYVRTQLGPCLPENSLFEDLEKSKGSMFERELIQE